MRDKQEVNSYDPEWALIDYKIQMITGKSSLQIISLYRYDDGYHNEDQFRTEAALQVTDLDREYVERVVRKTLPTEEMVFYCGHVNIHPLIKPNKVFTLLLCRLNLGRIGTIRDEVSLADSVLLESDSDKDAFQYNFLINNHSRYTVKYEVNFTIGDEKEFVQNDYICMNCQNKKAKVHCVNEQILLCDQCTKDHHSRRMMQGHELEKIDKVNTLPLCKTHNQQFKYYCQRCQKYLCSICLQKGNSHGNNEHPVFQIAELYQQKHDNNDTQSVRQKDKLENLLRSLQLKKEEIEQNYRETKKFLDEQYEKSINTLSTLFMQKMFVLKSDEIEIKLTSERLEWSRIFILFQEKNLKPLYYFQSQEKFEQELSKFKINQFSSIYATKADLVAEGEIIVARKDLLDRSRSRAAPMSVANERGKGEPRGGSLSGSKALPKARTAYEYDSNAQWPVRGSLAMLLQNSQLNFFHIPK